jgi:ribosomal-protein-alanine N-acetyltransferase
LTHSTDNGERSPTILETERLTLRYQQPSDVDPLVDLWADPEVTRYMGGPRDRAWLQSAFEETARDPYAERYDLWALIEKETEQVVGHCGLLDKEVDGRQEIELIYVLASSVWGKGYATEIGRALKAYAFEEIGLGRLIALIEPENTASERVADKVGMRLEKEVVRPGGELRKVYVVEREVSAPRRFTRGSTMQIGAGAGMLLLTASVFLTYHWLRTERWIMGYDFLAWIVGFGIAGLVLLYVTRGEWRKQRIGSFLLQFVVILVTFLLLLYGVTIYRTLFVLRGWQ